MRLKVICKQEGGAGSNYFTSETSVVNRDTGEVLEGVVKVSWELDAERDFVPTATITLIGVEADLDGVFEVEDNKVAPQVNEFIMPQRQELEIFEDNQPDRPPCRLYGQVFQ